MRKNEDNRYRITVYLSKQEWEKRYMKWLKRNEEEQENLRDYDRRIYLSSLENEK